MSTAKKLNHLIGREVYFTMSKKDHARLKCSTFFTPKKRYLIVAASHNSVSIHCNPHCTDSQANKLKKQGVLVNIFLNPKTCAFLTVPACKATGEAAKTKGWALAAIPKNKPKPEEALTHNKAAPKNCASLSNLLSSTPSLARYEVTPMQRASGANEFIGTGKESVSPSKLREKAKKQVAKQAVAAAERERERLKQAAKKLMVKGA